MRKLTATIDGFMVSLRDLLMVPPEQVATVDLYVPDTPATGPQHFIGLNRDWTRSKLNVTGICRGHILYVLRLTHFARIGVRGQVSWVRVVRCDGEAFVAEEYQSLAQALARADVPVKPS